MSEANGNVGQLNIARALDFIDKLQTIDNASELISSFEDVIRHFGCSMFSAGIVENPARIAQPVLISTWPEEWRDHWVSHKYWHVDPVVHAMMVRTEPFEWKEIFDVSTAEGRQVFYEARAFGLTDGFTVPTPSQGQMLNTVTVVGEQLDWSSRERAVMHLVGLYFLGRLKHLKLAAADAAPEDRPHLSNREAQVINYVAAGKTTGEIGDLLNVSDSTVAFHTQNVLRKLNSHSRAQAVIEAYRHGLLRL